MILWHDIIVNFFFFWRCFVSIVKFSYCSKFQVNIITCSGFMTIFFYKGFTRNLEIGNTLIWVLPNIWRRGWVMDTKFCMNISYRILLNVAKCQGYSFYRFWVIKGKPKWGRVKLLPPHTRTHTNTHTHSHTHTHTHTHTYTHMHTARLRLRGRSRQNSPRVFARRNQISKNLTFRLKK